MNQTVQTYGNCERVSEEELIGINVRNTTSVSQGVNKIFLIMY